MQEIWKDIEFFEGQYKISNKGRVKSLRRYSGHNHLIKERILRPETARGYLRVLLYKNKIRYKRLVHRLVAMAFISNLYHLPEVNHIDGDKANNHVENLEWITKQGNIDHSVLIGLRNHKGENNPSAKLCKSQIIKIIKLYGTGLYSQEAIGRRFKVGRSIVGNIVRGESWKSL